MSFSVMTVSFGAALFVGMLVCLEIGRRLRAQRPKEWEAHFGAMDAAIFGLVGLLVGFTFYGAAERFQHRRELVGEEANAISTAYLRVGMMQPERQAQMRATFRSYLDARLAVYKDVEKLPDTLLALKRVEALQNDLWSQALASLRAPDGPTPLALVVPLNQMFDVASTRVHSMTLHPPKVIFALLTLVSLIAAGLGGFGIVPGDKAAMHMLVYAAVMAATIFVIIELEYPRAGIIRVDSADEILFDLKDTMKD